MRYMAVFLILAAVLGLLALLTGSLGAHWWQDLLMNPDTAARFQRAEDYLFYHALVLIGVALLVERFPKHKFQHVGWCLAAGALIFSGSLVTFSLTGYRPVIGVTPVGGLLLFIGWIILGVRSFQIFRQLQY